METIFYLDLIGCFKQILSPHPLSGPSTISQIMTAFNLAEKIIESVHAPAVQLLRDEKAEWQDAINLLADYVLDWEDLIIELPKQHAGIIALHSLENRSMAQIAKLTAQSEETCRELFEAAVGYVDKCGLATAIKQKYESLLNDIKEQDNERDRTMWAAIDKKEGTLR